MNERAGATYVATKKRSIPLVTPVGVALCALLVLSTAHAQTPWESDTEEMRRMRESCRAASLSADGEIDRDRLRHCIDEHERKRQESQRTSDSDRRRALIEKELEETKSVTSSSSPAERERRDRAQCRAQSLNPDATVNDDAYLACRAARDRINGSQELAETRKRCGADYMRVALGMLWTRALDCAGPFRRISQINRRQRILTTYESALFRVSVIDGKIASWGHTGRQGFDPAQ